MDLDGAVRQKRQELEENSSSDSPAPDYDKIAGVCLRYTLPSIHSTHADCDALKLKHRQRTADISGEVGGSRWAKL